MQAAERSWSEGMGPMAKPLNLLSPDAKHALAAIKAGKFGKKEVDLLKKYGDLADTEGNGNASNTSPSTAADPLGIR